MRTPMHLTNSTPFNSSAKFVMSLRPIESPRKHNSRWSQEEKNLLFEAIKNGYDVEQAMELFPLRTRKAILNMALSFGYSSRTKDNKTLFVKGVKRRKRRTKEELQNEAAGTTSYLTNLKSLIMNIVPQYPSSMPSINEKIDIAENLLKQVACILDELRRAS
ncbi:hypothetical protein [Hydrogenimonas cancrithermarum]|uniref:Myb-like domain-containing protein n=1 Tax=Hydrogenimonas cancrithermarum TaxID=2993563 RepID=A0ABM8FJD8_9BACT|nr:hypothetical protein [Hydrogenimonas cancrithermarum]BDY12398.1 hypothetical protein HCR_07100 [Hydrogenimonas cancrithermarum]